MPSSIENLHKGFESGTILTALTQHVKHRPKDLLFTFIKSNKEAYPISFEAFHNNIQRIAGEISANASPGDRALLLYTSGIEFIETFIACLYAGIIAVPANAPRKNRNSERVLSIAKDCSPCIVLCDNRSKEAVSKQIMPILDNVQLLNTESLDKSSIKPVPTRKIDKHDIAFLQYTSGSTSQPKGIEISHQNIIINQEAMIRSGEHDQHTIMVNWLPLFHDMGLIATVLQPIFIGFHSVLMSPVSFLQRPVNWLEAITKYKATIAGCPNFAYDILINKVTAEEKKNLDLSSWKIAFNGAEPVRSSTIERFSEAFESCGFRKQVWSPCYGLAEATLFVSGDVTNRFPKIITLNKKALEQHKIVESDPNGNSQEYKKYVSCGKIDQAFNIAIVNPKNRMRCLVDEIGEIWLQGKSIANGYWNKPSDTQKAFKAQIKGEEGYWFRSGDMGFVDDNELFVTGRIKDLIIIRGRNIYPQDIEILTEQFIQFATLNKCAAFVTFEEGSPKLQMLIEADRALSRYVFNEDKEALNKIKVSLADLRLAVLRRFDIALSDIKFVKINDFPRTSSGKVQRYLCKKIFKTAPSKIIFWDKFHTTFQQKKQLYLTKALTGKEKLLKILEGVIDENLLVDLRKEASGSIKLEQLGVDSLSRAALAGELEKEIGEKVEPHSLGFKTINCLIEMLEGNASSKKIIESPILNENTLSNLNIDSRYLSLSDFTDKTSSDIFSKTLQHQAWDKDLKNRGHKKYMLPVKAYHNGRATVLDQGQEREVIFFCSADYLGLAQNEQIKKTAAQAVLEYGTNIAAVPIIAGTTPLHQQLEEKLAAWMGKEACVLFPTGHAANMSTVAALCSEKDYIIVDNQIHYSLLEGIRLAGSSWRTFLHNDVESLEKVLKNIRHLNPHRGILVLVEGVYGIGGDIANIEALVKVCQKYEARIMVDDAHGIGCMGIGGVGIIKQQSEYQPDIIMGSLSKAIGSFGGFICASKNIVNYLRYYAKSISFAVGMPIVNVVAALEGIHIIQRNPHLYIDLQGKARWFKSQLLNRNLKGCEASESQIISIHIGDELNLKNITKDAFDMGVWLEGLPFPAVSRGNEMLRFRVRYEHTKEDLLQTADIIQKVINENLPRRSSVQTNLIDTSNILNDEAVTEIVDLMILAAQQNNWGLPWLTRAYIKKYIKREAFWSSEAYDYQWHLIRNGEGRLVGTFCEDTRILRKTDKKPTKFLGSFVWDEQYYQQFIEYLKIHIDTIRVEYTIIAPANYPVQIFGSGVQDWHSTNSFPILEKHLKKQIGKDLVNAIGLKQGGEKQYFLVRLNEKTIGLIAEEQSHNNFTIRKLRRETLEEETRKIVPLINKTISKLPLCTQLKPALLLGLIDEMKDFLKEDICLLGEKNQSKEVLACAMCYPNIAEVFTRICGQANVVDFESIRQAVHTTSVGFLAWFAVDENTEKALTDKLLKHLHSQLCSEGYTHLWISWEIVNPFYTPEEIAKELGEVEAKVQMPYFSNIDA